MRSYKEHYEHCRNISDVASDKGVKYSSLYEFGFDKTILDTNDQYFELVKKISKKITHKLDNEPDSCYNVGFATYVNDWRDIAEISKLADIVMPQIEKKVFHCNLKIEFVLPYRNNVVDSDLAASWLWHYDDCPSEYIKLVIYLNDTDESSGCFQYISVDGKVPVLPSSRFSPEKRGQQYFPGSRVPEFYVNDLLSKSGKITSLTGPQGTYALFTPNIIHRATVPKKKSLPREALFFYIRPSIEKAAFINADTKSILPSKDVKVYKLD